MLRNLNVNCDPATDPIARLSSRTCTANLLPEFRDYVNSTRNKMSPENLIARYGVHLFHTLVHEDEDGVIGCAYLDAICLGEYSSSVNRLADPSFDANLRLLAHEIGHNLGGHHVDNPANLMYPFIMPEANQSFLDETKTNFTNRQNFLKDLVDQGYRPE